MRRTGALLVTLGALAWAGCATPDPIVHHARMRLRLPTDTECHATGSRLVVQALGDFPASERFVDGLAPSGMALEIDRFPWDTRALTVRGFADEEVAGGVLSLGGGDVVGDVLLLPYGRPCALADTAAAAPAGSTSIALPDGGLLVVGGGADATRIARLPPGGQLLDTTAALFNPRFGASATVADDEVVIAGGGFGETGPVQSNFEVYDLATRAVRAGGALCDRRGRRDHGSVPLGDGRVLLVGGIETEGGSPRDDAEILDAATGCVERIDGLVPARTHPTVLALDDGTIIVVGGRNSLGRYEQQTVVFDAQSRTFAPHTDDFPRYEDAAIVPLPGGRVAALGGYSVPAGGGCRVPVASVSVLLPDGSIADLGPLADVDASAPHLRTLEEVRAVPLADGTVLVTGRDDGDTPGVSCPPDPPDPGAPRAVVVDVGRLTRREDPDGAPLALPTELVLLADGAVAELHARSGALRRELLLTPFDNPPSTLLQGDTIGVAVDAFPRWTTSTGSVTAQGSGARIDLPTLRFARFRAELDADDGAALLIQRDHSYPEAVPLFEASAGMALCDVARVAGAPMRVERDGDVLRISAGGDARACRVNPLGERVGIAVTARDGTVIRSLRVTRLP